MLLMGKSTISMVMFNSYVKLPEGNGIFRGITDHIIQFSVRDCWRRDHRPRICRNRSKTHATRYIGMGLSTACNPKNSQDKWTELYQMVFSTIVNPFKKNIVIYHSYANIYHISSSTIRIR